MRVSVIFIIAFTLLGLRWDNYFSLFNLPCFLEYCTRKEHLETAIFNARFNNLSRLCIGKDRTFVLTLLGEPRSVDGPIRIKHFPLAAATADRNWLYEYNAACYAVSFKAKKCIAIEYHRYASDQRWQERRGKLISHWCIGKSLAQVFEGLGRTKCKLNSIPRRSKATGGIAWEQDCNYEVGGNIGVYIKFEEGHCVEASPMHIFH